MLLIENPKNLLFLQKRRRKALGIGKDEGRAVLNMLRISSRKVKIVLRFN